MTFMTAVPADGNLGAAPWRVCRGKVASWCAVLASLFSFAGPWFSDLASLPRQGECDA